MKEILSGHYWPVSNNSKNAIMKMKNREVLYCKSKSK